MEHNDYGMDRHDNGSGWVALLALVMVSLLLAGTLAGLALFARPSDAASSIDATYPVAGSVAVSTPVRGNFSIAKSEISALQAKFPSSSGTNNIASYADGTGSLKDAGICATTGTTNDTKTLVCGGRLDLNFPGSSGYMLDVTGVSGDAAVHVSQLGAGDPLQVYAQGLERLRIGNGGTSAITSEESNPTLTLEKTIIDGNVFSAFNSQGYGVDLRASAGTGDASQPVWQVDAATSSAGEAIVQYYQNDEGPMQVRSTVTTGLDPYELFRQQRRETTNATPTTFLYAVSIPTGQAYALRSTVTAFVTTGAQANKVADYEIACAASNIGGTTTLIGSSTTELRANEESGLSALAVACAINDSTDTLNVQVTGLASNTIVWHDHRTVYRFGNS